MELNEQTLDQILTRQRKEYESILDAAMARQGEKLDAAMARQDENLRHLGVQFESLESKVKLLAEVVEGFSEELSSVAQMCRENTAAIETLEVGQLVQNSDTARGLAGKVDRTEFAQLESRVVRLETPI